MEVSMFPDASSKLTTKCRCLNLGRAQEGSVVERDVSIKSPSTPDNDETIIHGHALSSHFVSYSTLWNSHFMFYLQFFITFSELWEVAAASSEGCRGYTCTAGSSTTSTFAHSLLFHASAILMSTMTRRPPLPKLVLSLRPTDVSSCSGFYRASNIFPWNLCCISLCRPRPTPLMCRSGGKNRKIKTNYWKMWGGSHPETGILCRLPEHVKFIIFMVYDNSKLYFKMMLYTITNT